ncbi:hypothetical protein ACG02S_15695 [Roseateles sp. DC23W]|uniref:Pentapeptide repeat-containing protein n=1 Tax=Pelomonas dachongensis TaxID=3299029 RepID=A0ABW7EPH1_9BURK
MSLAPQLPLYLKADCSACVALCCVVPPFDAVQGFGFDKQSETPCHHLCADHRCGIHDGLIAQGFSGCVAFDCLGAGQRLTAQARERFGSADWRARPDVARWLFSAYPRVREAHEWLARLALAASVTGRPALQALADELDAESPRWADWAADEYAAWQGRVRAVLVPLAQNRVSTSRN